MAIVQVHQAWSGQSGLRHSKGSPPKPLGLTIEGCLPPSEEVVGFNIGFPTPPRRSETMLVGLPIAASRPAPLDTQRPGARDPHKTSCERLPSTPLSRWCSHTYPSAKAKSAGCVWGWVWGWTWGNVGGLGIMDRSRRGLDLEDHVCIPPPCPADREQPRIMCRAYHTTCSGQKFSHPKISVRLNYLSTRFDNGSWTVRQTRMSSTRLPARNEMDIDHSPYIS